MYDLFMKMGKYCKKEYCSRRKGSSREMFQEGEGPAKEISSRYECPREEVRGEMSRVQKFTREMSTTRGGERV